MEGQPRAGQLRMFDEVGPQFAHNLVQKDGYTYIDGEHNIMATDRDQVRFAVCRCSLTSVWSAGALAEFHEHRQ